MTTIVQVLDGIRDAIRTGLASDAIAGRTFSLAPDSLNPPTVVVVPAPGTFDGTANFAVLVKVLNGSQDSTSSQTALLGYMAKSGSTSIRAAILASPTLSGICSYMLIPSAQNYGDVEWAGQTFLGFELQVAVFT